MKNKQTQYYILTLVSWTILIVSLLLFEYNNIQENAHNIALAQARSNFNKDLSIRLWAASHGGVYVPIDSITQPNPALAHIEERDIQSVSGKKYTLMNPAYMIRELNEHFAKYYGIVGHITSKKLLRPENKPDAWEIDALNQFEKGAKEVSAYSMIDNKQYLRLMQPMITHKSCLKCHAHQGYKVGDIRGGVGIAIPIESILVSSNNYKQQSNIIFSLIWLIGFIGITISYKKTSSNIAKQKQMVELLEIQKEELLKAKTIAEKNEHKFSTAFENHPTPMQIVNLKTGERFELNESGYRLFEINENDSDNSNSKKGNLFNNNAWVKPEIQKKGIEQLINNGSLKNYPIDFLSKSGELKNLLISGSTLDIDEGNLAILALVDITAQKHIEQKLKKQNEQFVILNDEYLEINKELSKAKEIAEHNQEMFSKSFHNSPLIMTITKLDDGTIVEINENFIKTTGYSRSETIGNTAPDMNLYSLEAREKVKKELIANGRLDRTLISFKKKTGELFSCYVYAEIISIGNERRIFTIIDDITDKLEAEQKLQIQNEELFVAKEKAEESDKLKTEFLNNMSHEIRTPLNGILGFSQLLNEPNYSLEQKNTFISTILNSGQQLLKIIEEILEISQLSTKQVKIHNDNVSINGLLFDLFSIYDVKAKENKTPLYLKRELSDRDSTIYTDQLRISTILNNIIENALKFTNIGHIDFGYNLCSIDNKQFIQIYIKDTGIGIKPENQTLIFKQFSQEEKALSRSVGGLGLGLSIAKENAKLLGGDIVLESEKGIGSTFTITIPYLPVYPIEDKIMNKKHTVMIAEDEEVNYIYMEVLLKDILQLDCSIIHVINGQEAVNECLQNSNIDLIIMDLKMNEMDGFEASKQIKAIYPNIPIIAQTSYSTNKDKENAKIAGCDDFISKPINTNSFRNIISKYLEI